MGDDLTTTFGLTAEDIARFEEAGVLKPVYTDGAGSYAGHELRLEVIAKAQKMGFSFDEIVALIRLGAS